MPFFDSNDGSRLFFTDWGAGDDAVVLVHAWALNSDMWNYQIPALVDAGYRVLTFDRRGHGRSDRPGRGYDMDTLADDLAALIEHLDLRGITVVGHSMGAAEVVRFVTRHGSSRVDRIVLSAPTTPMLLKTADNPAGIDPAVLAASRQLMMRDLGSWVEAGTSGYWGTPAIEAEVSAAMTDWTKRAILDTPLPIALATSAAFATADFRAELATITVPALVIHGDADQSAPVDLTGRPSAALLPNSRLVVFEGAGHGLYFSQGERYNAELVNFIRSTSSPRAAATAASMA